MSVADQIRESIDLLAHAITERHAEKHPEIFARYPAVGRQRCREDARFHLQYLAAALEAESETMFVDYVAWAKVMLAARNVPATDLADNLGIVIETLEVHGAADAVPYVRAAVAALPSMPDEVPSFLDPARELASLAGDYLAHLLRGGRRDAAQLVMDALDRGVTPRDVYRQLFEPVQQEIGRLWQLNRITVAQEHFCTAATQQIMTQLYGRIFGGERREQRAVAMCVGGELHEIGLRIITDLLELEGWQTWYLGANVPPPAAVQMCVDRRADVLLVSATLPPHIASVREVIRIFRSTPALAHAKVVVGGRAFRAEPELWRSIGADGYAPNADECLAVIDRLVA